jgi:hypothetical protein
MLLIHHRINTIQDLQKVPLDRGIEIDIREHGGEIGLAHDPFSEGETLDAFLRSYRHAFVVFNMKCDGLEQGVLRLAERHNISDFFFLDVSNPTLVQLVRGGERRVAVRYSEFEPIEFALAFAGLAEWVWVDCFTRLPLDRDSYERLHRHFKICLVSPELQRHDRRRIQDFRAQLGAMPCDAVCTDYCEDWLETAPSRAPGQ